MSPDRAPNSARNPVAYVVCICRAVFNRAILANLCCLWQNQIAWISGPNSSAILRDRAGLVSDRRGVLPLALAEWLAPAEHL
jgi:hypothetical protein